MEHLDERLKPDDVILPQAQAADAVQEPSEYVDMQDYREALIILTATLGQGESVVCQARESSSAAGADLADLGAAITIDDVDNPIAYINVVTNAMSDGTRFLGVRMTPAGGTVEISAVIVRGEARYKAPAQNVDASLVID